MNPARNLDSKADENQRLTIKVFQNGEEVALEAARELAVVSATAIAERGRFRLALSGGSTPKKLYSNLAGPPFAASLDWGKFHFYWGDERCVPPTHPDSNFGMANDVLLSKISADPKEVFRMQAEAEDPAKAAIEYEEALKRDFGSAGMARPEFDLLLLGMGPDGHTASLFPGTGALSEMDRWVVANYVPKFNAYRLTLTFPALNSARNVFILVVGEDKAEIVGRTFREKNGQDYPVKRIQPDRGKVIWFLDRAAARELGNSA